MQTEVFKPGDRVRVIGGRCAEQWLNYNTVYTVVEYLPELPVDFYKFPAYVVIMGDTGHRGTWHAHRFTLVKE
jgi:hypothetical protein